MRRGERESQARLHSIFSTFLVNPENVEKSLGLSTGCRRFLSPLLSGPLRTSPVGGSRSAPDHLPDPYPRSNRFFGSSSISFTSRARDRGLESRRLRPRIGDTRADRPLGPATIHMDSLISDQRVSERLINMNIIWSVDESFPRVRDTQQLPSQTSIDSL